MDKNEKITMLKNYIISNTLPIMIDFIEGKYIPDSVILQANCNITELNGHYVDKEFVAPKWFNELNNKILLVIDNIDSISKEEQLKFIELLKYRKVSTFELPKNVVIIITAKKISRETINEEIYSLVAHIGS